jgi:tRNA1(Val) A37 N6-methylase TrmN6
MELTHGHLLGGRVRYAQPADGYRTGIEPVLLASASPARPGERVLEAGCGAGAGLLCLAARVPGIRGIGVEIDPAMADLARRNIRDNGFDGIEIVTGDIGTVRQGPFDHAFANPPWHDPRSTRSPVDRRRLAKQAQDGDLERWVGSIGGMLAPGGSLTLILPAAQLDRALAAVAEIAGGTCVRGLRPKHDRSPKLVIVQAGRGASDSEPGLAYTVLHQPDGSFTAPIEAVLREGAAFPV